MSKIGALSRQIASVGRLGRFPFGGIIFSVTGLFIMYLFQAVLALQTRALLAVTGGLTLVILVILQIAVTSSRPSSEVEGQSSQDHYDKSTIIIDRILGMICAFLLVPGKLKIMLFGFVLFHVFSLGQYLVQFRGFSRRLSDLPGVLGVVADDILSGVLVNVFLQLMIWIVH